MRYIFGPVPSRRFGRSLGIDIIPPPAYTQKQVDGIIPRKKCTLDCIYCQIGRTTDLTLKRKPYAAVKPVLNELKKILKSKVKIDYLTFSGSGEPTLNSNIGKIISEIKNPDFIGTNIPVVVLTGGTLLYRKDVRDDLLNADIVAPSLDAILNFKKINRPHKKLDIKKIIDGLVSFRKIFNGKIWLETLFVKNFNDSPAEIKALKKAIQKIRPDKIHLNTVSRPPSESYAKPLEWNKLMKIKKYFGKNCEILADKKHIKPKSAEENISERILEMLKRRPMRLKDITTAVPAPAGNKTILKELWLLERKRKITCQNNWWKWKNPAI